MLFCKGYASFSGLTLAPGCNWWKSFVQRLEGALIVIPLITEEFYESPATMEEMAMARYYNVRVIPLRFAPSASVPKAQDQWPHVRKFSFAWCSRAIAQGAVSGRNTIPPRGTFLEDVAANFEELLEEVKIVMRHQL